MTSNSLRMRVARSALLGVFGLALALPAAAGAQSGNARAAYVSTVATGATSIASASVPAGGGMESVDAFDAGVVGVLSTRAATALSTGIASAKQAGVQSVSSVSDVSILEGRVTAASVMAIASAGQGFAEATGSSLGTVVVNGVSYDGDAFAPNTRFDLPGVGYVIFNEQIAGESSMTVNMIHVTLTGLFGAKTGEIIVGSATSDCSQ